MPTATAPPPRHGPTPTWAAPTAAGPVRAAVEVPGSKSHTARALVLASLAGGPTLLRRPLRARDTLLMAAAMRALGAGVRDAGDDGDDWLVEPGQPARGDVVVDVGNSGTVTRFAPAVAALSAATVVFDGDPRIRDRPVGPLLGALRELGVDLDDGGRGALPVTVRGHGRLPGGTAELDASASSQLVSGLLLAAPRSDEGVTVRHVGTRIPSLPHIAMTVAELRRFGAAVTQPDDTTWRVEPGPLHAGDVAIEPDLSSAVAFACAPLVAGGSVLVRGWPEASTQPGAALPALLESLGADVSRAPGGLLVEAAGPPRAIDVDLADFPEAAPVLAAVLLFADGASQLRGIAHLRAQETDRLRALAEELGRLGGDVVETEDGVRVTPGPLRGAELDPRADHRLAMAYAVAALRVPGVAIADAGTVAKTVPDFQQRWDRMLAGSDG